ncbi:MAG: hypothetical protein KME22_07710 [Hassallia sp. WJT32-NPBG1]|jgi:hypothetical protein|nr:hypothetical protein [Hassallia sp. WJT32-NPBG1]
MLATNECINVAKSKRLDPNYTKVTADIEREVAIQTRALCALSEMSLSEAVNEALKMWNENKKKEGYNL